MKYGEDIIRRVASSNDIVDVISEYVPLKKSGKHFKGISPFTQEKTPSFFVSSDKQLFHCFSSGVGGDVFTFLMKVENFGFQEALKKLADRARIPLPEPDGRERRDGGKREKMFEACSLTADFFQKQLLSPSGQAGRDYLAKRGVSEEMIKLFQVGWAPADWRVLLTYLQSKGIPDAIAEEAALVKKSPKGHLYDVFRGRVMFPIKNAQDKIIAFGGRKIGDEEGPKYLNSPESPIFSKKQELFGLHLARKSIDEVWRHMILVEGYMDAMTLYQFGFKNVVATLGTALGESHARILKRYVDEVVVLYDGDVAGQNAAMRGLEILLEAELHVRVIVLPDGLDPDDYLKKYGHDALKEVIKNSPDFLKFKLDAMLKNYSKTDPMGIVKMTNELMETFLKVKNEVLLSSYFKRLAEELRIDEASLRREFFLLKQKTEGRRPLSGGERKEQEAKQNVQPAARAEEVMLLALMFSDEVFRKEGILQIQLSDWTDEDARILFEQLVNTAKLGAKPSMAMILPMLQSETFRGRLTRTIAFLDEVEDKPAMWRDCFGQMRGRQTQNRLDELRELIVQAEKNQLSSQLQTYLAEYQALLQRGKPKPPETTRP